MSLKYNFGGIEGAASSVQGAASSYGDVFDFKATEGGEAAGGVDTSDLAFWQANYGTTASASDWHSISADLKGAIAQVDSTAGDIAVLGYSPTDDWVLI